MFKGKNIDNMTIGEALHELTDWNWHTERCVIEAILLGDESAINNALTAAISHRLMGHLTHEAAEMRKAAYKVIEANRKD